MGVGGGGLGDWVGDGMLGAGNFAKEIPLNEILKI